ncbi:hypothetical protein CALVIDRAFT_603289 [Calocera viscosa TUFC12733]|uniref:Uncharacterized protein n=1 Tax=Calocera viscosa (strain TUFC12733) TaxID=1330018 RepID=A0A167FY99_CALVF|nr:hypothetical protein CALVIDRAFT_603289 [Calocera viscosa TUFC12733]
MQSGFGGEGEKSGEKGKAGHLGDAMGPGMGLGTGLGTGEDGRAERADGRAECAEGKGSRVGQQGSRHTEPALPSRCKHIPPSAYSSTPYPAFHQSYSPPLLPTPTTPISALYPLKPFCDYEQAPPVNISTTPPSSPTPQFPSPPRRAFDHHWPSNDAPGLLTRQPLVLPPFPRAHQSSAAALPARAPSPPGEPPSDTDSASLHTSGTGSPSPGALSPSRSSSFKSRPSESWVPTLPDPSPSKLVLTRTSSASSQSTASARSQLSLHATQSVSMATRLATVLVDLEPEDGEDVGVNVALSQRTPGVEGELVRMPSEGPINPGLLPRLQAVQGIAIGLNAPANDTLFHHRHLEPIVFPELVLLDAASPMHISEPIARSPPHPGALRQHQHGGPIQAAKSAITQVGPGPVVRVRPSVKPKRVEVFLKLTLTPGMLGGVLGGGWDA